MKKFMLVLSMMAMVAMMVVGCKKAEPTVEPTNENPTETEEVVNSEVETEEGVETPVEDSEDTTEEEVVEDDTTVEEAEEVEETKGE